jgi:hypothetical protein
MTRAADAIKASTGTAQATCPVRRAERSMSQVTGATFE